MLFDEVMANLDVATALEIEKVTRNIPQGIKLSLTHHLTEINRDLYDEGIKF